ncbi:MAG: carboxymuconolactone decarboxylase [Chloroflexi bacterium]|nr:carboxymuconolactone decarboxylase [Chloroflexota bacterium]
MAAPSAEEMFRRLTLGEPRLLAAVAQQEPESAVAPRLDPMSEALLPVAALIALDAPESSYRTVVDAAQRSGATLDDLLAVLVAVAGQVGSARVTSAAPRIALAAGYDAEADIDRYEPDDGHSEHPGLP